MCVHVCISRKYSIDLGCRTRSRNCQETTESPPKTKITRTDGRRQIPNSVPKLDVTGRDSDHLSQINTQLLGLNPTEKGTSKTPNQGKADLFLALPTPLPTCDADLGQWSVAAESSVMEQKRQTVRFHQQADP